MGINQTWKFLTQVSLTSAMTGVALIGTTLMVSSVLIEAYKGNQGFCYIGNTSTVATLTGHALPPEDRISIAGDPLDINDVNSAVGAGSIDLSKIYFSADTHTSKLIVSYLE